jgi:phosphoadenosine phosphosulfate reductase
MARRTAVPRDILDDGRARAAELAARHGGSSAHALLTAVLHDSGLGRVALVSSFGAESVVLLHLVARVAPALPVLFLETEMLFPETLAYQADVAATLGLSDVRRITPSPEAIAAQDPDGRLNARDPDACCRLRKAEPLARALSGFDAWITGRKRFQGGARAALPLFEADDAGRIKVNPLAGWGPWDISDYIRAHDLPRHPLVDRGYPSIGCAPCTAPVRAGEDMRAGRWRGSAKTECGIHFANGRAMAVATPGSGRETGL